jgi:endo-1,4-beta-xylanase
MRHRARKSLTRRSAVLGLGTAAIVSTALAGVGGHVDSMHKLHLPLRRLTYASGIRFGCAASAPCVQPNATLLEKIATEANIFIPENHLKWEFTEPRLNEFDFVASDSIADFATRHDMLMHGHTLVWHNAIPSWVAEISTARDAKAALERHIATLVSRYRGTIWAWDVVNEPIEPKDGLENGYRNSIWFRWLGKDYVDLAFRIARVADVKTPLSLNEYGVEYIGADCEQRRRDILALLQVLRDRNTPIDCLGLQSHLSCHRMFDRKELTQFLREVADLGYHLMITELDVNDVKILGGVAERDAAVARHVDEYLDIVFSIAHPLSVSTWGLSDRYTWLSQHYTRVDGQPLRPLPLDAEFIRKPMWWTLAKYIGAPKARSHSKLYQSSQ